MNIQQNHLYALKIHGDKEFIMESEIKPVMLSRIKKEGSLNLTRTPNKQSNENDSITYNLMNVTEYWLIQQDNQPILIRKTFQVGDYADSRECIEIFKLSNTYITYIENIKLVQY